MTSQEYEQIRAALVAIGDGHHGIVNPRTVLEAARDPAHVLHGQFDWNDASAADGYRLAQAAALIRRVKLTIVRESGEPRALHITTTRQFQSRPSMRTRVGGYEPIEDVLDDTDKRRELLAQVLRDLTAYRRRYSELSELDAVWSALDDVVDTTAPSVVAPADGAARPGVAG